MIFSYGFLGPRWASWNLGVFLCIRCAGIHRNLGVHISKVKSVNLDSWTPEQVVSLQQMGNSRARAVYEANLPDNFRRPQNDSSLESFIRAKYEHKKYIAREWVPPVIPKVDWEKEIDEEIERQKRKKKSAVATDKKPIKIGASEVPQIPKPKSSASPKPSRITAHPSSQESGKGTQDLLGLQNGEDTFSSFLSACSKQAKAANEAAKKEADVRAEEESFFNQPAPTEKEKSKLTKDSILALYGNTPQQPVYNPVQVAGGMYAPVSAPVYAPGPAFQQFPAAQQFPPQGPYQAQPYQMQNGMGHFQQSQFQQPAVQYAMFGTNTGAPSGAPGQIPQQFQQQQQQQPYMQQQYMPQQQFQQFQTAGGTPNPFCNVAGVQQQLSNMSLTGQLPQTAKGMPPPAAQPLATNLWQ